MAGKSQATSPKGGAEESARGAIMNAAERLFAERGIDAVSLRTINTEAGYSVAALHYHFGTRDGLVRALLQRAQPAMFQQRAAMVAHLEAKEHPEVEEIVEALVHPLTAGMLENFGASVISIVFRSGESFAQSTESAGFEHC